MGSGRVIISQPTHLFISIFIITQKKFKWGKVSIKNSYIYLALPHLKFFDIFQFLLKINIIYK